MQEKVLTGTKLNMSQIFMPYGKVIPVTVVKLKSAEKADKLLDAEVTVTGTSKGKGFAGAIKKWGFAKQGETRGAKDKVRAPGAIGSQTPGRVWPGKKMAGKMGSKTVTVKGLKVVEVNSDENSVMVSGPIPGARNSDVFLKFDAELFEGEEEASNAEKAPEVEVQEEEVEKVDAKVEEKAE